MFSKLIYIQTVLVMKQHKKQKIGSEEKLLNQLEFLWNKELKHHNQLDSIKLTKLKIKMKIYQKKLQDYIKLLKKKMQELENQKEKKKKMTNDLIKYE